MWLLWRKGPQSILMTWDEHILFCFTFYTDFTRLVQGVHRLRPKRPKLQINVNMNNKATSKLNCCQHQDITLFTAVGAAVSCPRIASQLRRLQRKLGISSSILNPSGLMLKSFWCTHKVLDSNLPLTLLHHCVSACLCGLHPSKTVTAWMGECRLVPRCAVSGLAD